ncbi:MAG: TonB-dependent receptor [Acidobacteriaceae bacterium]
MTLLRRLPESLRRTLIDPAFCERRLTSPHAVSAVFCVILMLALVCMPRLSAQTATGSIVGTVTDQTGGVIVKASVTLTDVDTNQVIRTVATDQRGYYALTLLPPATYRLSVEANGFRQFLQSGIKLDVGATLTVDVPLQVGHVSQKVVVTGEPSLLQTETSSLGQVILNQPIVDLPVNGRNSYSFATLVPGVLASYGFTQPAVDEYNDQFVSINGSRPNANSFLLDGGVNSEPAFNGPGLYPSIDMVQQYKVQTNNYSAEFPNTAGGVVNVITKSGTNKFHGALYEFHRSTGLNANNFFAIRAGLSRAPFLYNQFGVALGGPVLPNHTFFFFSYEGLRWTQAVTTTATLPTAAERGGDFSGQPLPIYNPFSTTLDPSTGQYSRTQFGGNVIPGTMLDSTAKALLNYLPLPNQPGSPLVNNFISNASSPIDKNDFSLRIDQQVTRSSRLFGRFSISDTAQDRPPVWGNTPDLAIGSPVLGNDTLRQMQATVDDTTVLSPRVVLELNSSFVRYHLNRTPPGLGIPETQFGFPSYFSQLSNTVQCFPSISIAGVGSAQSIPNVGSGLAMGSYCFVGVLRDAYQVYNEAGNVTAIAGTHTLKFGGDLGIGTVATARFNDAGGYYAFGPDFTQGPSPYDSGTSGVGFASFMLGAGDFGFNYTGGPDEITSYKYYGGYFEDDWKVNHRLTMNLGFRYDYDAPWTERFNRITDWNPNATSPLQVPGLALVGGLEFPGVDGLSRYQFNPDQKTGMQPRVGFAYYAGMNTVFRGGYGLFMAPVVGGGFNGNAVPNTGFLGSTPWVNSLNGVNPQNTLSNPYPTGFVFGTGSSQGLATELGQSVVGMSRARRTSYTEQWNLDIQHTFPMHFLVDLAYAGSHGIHLYGDYDANQLPDKYLSFGTQLISQVSNPFYGHISSGSLSGQTVAESQLLLPYPQFTGVTLGDSSSYGASVYNSLQAMAERRFDNGFGLVVSYTLSKLMDNVGATETGFPGGTYSGGGIQDWYNLHGAWARGSFDTPNYLAINGTYDLPFGSHKRWLNSGGVANYLIGGWQLNGISYIESGNPLQVFTAANTLYNNGGTQLANWNGKNPIPDTPVKDRLNAYFNVSDFTAPAPFTYGDSPRLIGSLRDDGEVDLDLSGVKNTSLDHDRYNVQFRAEAFNIFNHPQFGPPDTALGDGTTGIISDQLNNPRELQFAMKVLF